MLKYKELTRAERKVFLSGLGLKPYREKQIFQWICRGAAAFDEMSDLSKIDRTMLAGECMFETITIDTVQKSSDGTRKYLLTLPDGNKVEAVYMEYEYGNSLCISTQVGCAMGCSFCASTLAGKIRNLYAWEMLDEYAVVQKDAAKPINHIVLMGIGEPFDNYEQLCAFLDMIHDPDGIGLSFRNITVSTCGIIPKIAQFGEDYPQVNLAVSLHASSQQEREKIMPVARAYKLDELIKACRQHGERTGRRMTFEYTLIRGRNDSDEAAAGLVSLLSGLLCHVNLIQLNPVEETGLQSASRQSAVRFCEYLQSHGIPCSIRRRLGTDIDAACGQLRRSKS